MGGGFLVFHFADRYDESRRQIAQWLKEHRAKYREIIVNGLENSPKGFVGFLRSENIGKVAVRVARE